MQPHIKAFRLALPSAAIALAALATSCEDETNKIGSSLVEGDIRISIDTLYYDLDASPLENNDFDSRTGNLLLGNLDAPQYGRLKCSFVSRMMCATRLDIPDSLRNPDRVDSCFLVLRMYRGDLTGDSVAPQKVTAYSLTKQLPSGITNTFNPEGYYSASSMLGSQSFTASYVGKTDSLAATSAATQYNNTISIPIRLPKEYGVKVFEEYKENPSLFQWPSTFAEKYPGIFVETSFGKGCVANIRQVDLMIFGWTKKQVSSTVDGITTTTWEKTAFSTIPFTTAPEVLSSNNVSYDVADHIKNMVARKDIVITTPGGYYTSFKFPARELIRHYEKDEHNLSLISDLVFSIPADTIGNDFGIGAPPTLLLVKTSELADFFKNNKIPDGKTSFTAVYDSTNKQYRFASMRQYIVDLLAKGEITDSDVEFSVVPVDLTTETSNGYYQSTSYVTKCTPYTTKPTMTRLHTENAMIVFTFSSQIID